MEAEDFYTWKIEKLENEIELERKQRKILELELEMKELPPLLDAEGLSEWLDITIHAARTLMKGKDFPKKNIGGYKAITSKVIEWMANNIDD